MPKMKFKLKRPTRLGDLGPGFVGRIMLGHEDKDSKVEFITEQDVKDAGDFIAENMIGVTVTPARGRYRYTSGPRKGQMANESTSVFDVLGTKGTEDWNYPSCAVFKKKLYGIAKRLAHKWNQETAAVSVWCEDGNVEVDFAAPDPEAPLSGYRAPRRKRRSRRPARR